MDIVFCHVGRQIRNVSYLITLFKIFLEELKKDTSFKGLIRCLDKTFLMSKFLDIKLRFPLLKLHIIL